MIYATSDLHGNLPAPPADATKLLIAGDICPDFRDGYSRHLMDASGIQQADWLEEEFDPWLTDLTVAGISVVATWGNHDFVGQHPYHVRPLPWTLLVDAERDGVYGTPWVPGLPNWAFFADSRTLKLRAEAIPSGLDVLMTHGPPLGAGDFIPGGSEKQASKYGNTLGMSVGDPHLSAAIERAQPKVVICGHIHEARGVHHSFSPVPVYNVAAVDEDYNLHEDPWTPLPELTS